MSVRGYMHVRGYAPVAGGRIKRKKDTIRQLELLIVIYLLRMIWSEI